MFAYDTNTSSFTVIHSFGYGTDASQPRAPLLKAADGNLYGTAPDGGLYGDGAIFEFNVNTSAYTFMYSFGPLNADPYSGLLQGSDGNFYGTTPVGGIDGNIAGSTYMFNPSTGGLTVLHSFSNTGTDGGYPYGGLILGQDGSLYGTANSGGSNGDGILFKF